MKTFVARPSRWRMALLTAGSVAFVFSGLMLTGIFADSPKPHEVWIGWLTAAFFGLSTLELLRRLVDTSDVVRISVSGVYFRQWSNQTISWSEITHVSIWEFRGQQCIILHLVDPDRYPSTKLLGRLAGANRALTGGDIPISLTGTDGKVADAMKAIERFRR